MTRHAFVYVVGGGLAGSEAAFQLAERGHRVVLHEMRGVRGTEAHKTDRLAELVCSNTFKSTEVTNAHGLLKAEMRLLGSVVLQGADAARVAAGSALAVDRDAFSAYVHERVASHPNIAVKREEVVTVPAAPAIIATGPLTSDALAERVDFGVGHGLVARLHGDGDGDRLLVRADAGALVDIEHDDAGDQFLVDAQRSAHDVGGLNAILHHECEIALNRLERRQL